MTYLAAALVLLMTAMLEQTSAATITNERETKND